MEARSRLSNRTRLIVSLAYGTGVAVALVGLVPRSAATLPLLLIGLSMPLVVGFVPRNWIYGLRTPRTMRTTEEIWYHQNRIAGLAMLVAGFVWLLIVAMR
jgi:hypothetical protein